MVKFENIKVGDRVWSVQYGWGNVEGFHTTIDNYQLLKVRFDNGDFEYYFKDGRVNIDDVNPTLFWNEFYIPTDEEYRNGKNEKFVTIKYGR